MQAFYALLGLSKTDTGFMVAIYAIRNLALLLSTMILLLFGPMHQFPGHVVTLPCEYLSGPCSSYRFFDGHLDPPSNVRVTVPELVSVY